MSKRGVSISIVLAAIFGIAYLGIHSPRLPDGRPKNHIASDKPEPAQKTNKPSRLLPEQALPGAPPLPLKTEEVLTLLQKPEDSVIHMLDSWVSEYQANMAGPDYFDEYEIFTFDEEVLRQIKVGDSELAEFNFSPDASYTLSISGTVAKDGDWYFRAHLVDDPDGVTVITVFPDGRKWGEVHVPGRGLYVVRPTNILPYHIVYLATGIYDLD